MLAMFMSAIEATIVATAMPTIIGDPGGFSLLGGCSRSLLAQAITIPIYGRLADLMAQAGVLSSALRCSCRDRCLRLRPRHVLADGFRSAARVGRRRHHADRLHHHRRHLQRAPAAEGDGLPVERVWGVSAIIGPLLGAFIVQHLPWALVFWVNLPIGLLAMFFLWRYSPAYQQPRRHALDLAGTARLTLFVSRCCWRCCRWKARMVGGAVARAGGGVAGAACPPSGARSNRCSLALWQSRVIVAGNIGGLGAARR